MPTYRTIKPSDWTKSLLLIGIYVAIISITAFILLVTYWYLWIALAAGGMLILVLWHKKSTAYHCPKCSNEFEISFLTDFLSPHGVTKNGRGWTYLKCPKCQNRTKMEILVNINQNSQRDIRISIKKNRSTSNN
jgi:DNA-directed RNA polymerase subunit RPC12/RpoP